MDLKSVEPSEEVKALREELIAVVRKKAEQMDALEILAVLAYTVGQTIAMQDQRTVSPQDAIELVSRNIEAGNQHVIAELQNVQGQG